MNPSKATAEYAERRASAAARLRASSLIAFVVERAFRGLQRVSPATRLSKSCVDYYILGWAGLAMVLGVLGHLNYPTVPEWLGYSIWIAATLRVIDITQVVVNLGVFDHLGQRARDKQSVESLIRSLVLLVWNFLETIIWFGLAYLPLPFLQEHQEFWSRLYFSGVTQLTIGYGDLTPIGAARAVAVCQGLLGWLFSVMIIARIVGALPRLRSINESV